MALPRVGIGLYRCAERTAIPREEREGSPPRARAVRPSAAGPRRHSPGSIPGESGRAIRAYRYRSRCSPAAGIARHKEIACRPVDTAASCEQPPDVTRPGRSPALEFGRLTGPEL